MIPLLNWCLNHWWVFFWLGIFGVFDGVRDFFIGLAEGIAGIFDTRHKRRLQIARAELKAAKAQAAVAQAQHAPEPQPGQCVHRRVRQVRDRNDQLVAWLCTGCDTQLPADWAVAAEDLT